MNTVENFFPSLKKMDIGTGHGIPKFPTQNQILKTNDH